MKLRFVNITLLFIFLFSASTFANNSIVSADDEWITVRSKNFFLIGNAREKDIRRVATKLEQFRETFRLLFPNISFTQTIETNVVVFKNKKEYKPFLPKRSDGKPDEGIAGYFMPGEDVNYITLSTEGDREDTYGTIFHEYVHFLLNTNFGRSEIPPWFNEGLAEYYQTFKIENDQKVYLGNLQEGHLYLLANTELIPLKTFFSIDNYSLHQNGDHSRNIFYAQAWVLMHYLIQTKQSDNLSKFLGLVTSNVQPEKAFKTAFGSDYETMEKALKKYAKQSTFNISVADFKTKMVFDASMIVTSLSGAEANGYLGDLLYHMHDYEGAEEYLQTALRLDAGQSMANASLGLVRMRQNKYAEAKSYLEKAVAANRKNHFAHYNYAYVLSREALDEFGRVSGYPPETAEIMRKSLLEAIKINPNFTESYRLLAFIDMVNNENLDEAIALLKKALALQPGNEDYNLIIAGIYLRQNKFDEAEKIASKIAKAAVEPDVRSQAQDILANIKILKENRAEMEKYKRDSATIDNKPPNMINKSSLTAEEIKKIELENTIYAFNQQIKPPAAGEQQIIGYTQKVECLAGGVKYTIKTDTGTLLLKSTDFQGLNLLALSEETYSILLGCDAKVQDFKTVYTYRAEPDKALNTSGSLTGMAFVPEFFRLKTPEEMAATQPIIIVDDVESKDQMMDALRNSLRKTQTDEIRRVGILEKIECVKDASTLRVKIDGQTLNLKGGSLKDLQIMIYTPNAADIRFGCGIKPPPVKAVITYRPHENDSKKIHGEIVALEFVPESFELE